MTKLKSKYTLNKMNKKWGVFKGDILIAIFMFESDAQVFTDMKNEEDN